MLLTKTVKVKWNINNRIWLENKGYIFTKYKDELEIAVNDLSEGSNIIIDVLCDYCLEENIETIIHKKYQTYIKQNKKSIIQKDCCKDCITKKVRESNNVTFGVDYTSQLKEVSTKISQAKTYTQDFVENEFKKRGYILIGKYIDSCTPIKYICPLHEKEGILTIRFNNFLQGQGCKFCAIEKVANSNRATIEEVKKEFEKRNYTLLDTSYNDSKIKLKYICKEHPDIIQEITFASLKSGQGCKICGKISSIKKRSYTYEFALNEFLKRDLELLEEKESYINAKAKMKYRCKYHPEFIQEIALSTLLYGVGCKYCGFEKLSKSNSVNWKGGITHLSFYLRSKISQWRQDTLRKYNYKCIISGETKNLIVHHLYPFYQILHETLEIANINIKTIINEYTDNELKLLEKICLELHNKYGLGIVVSKKLHKDYHKIYGHKNNNIINFYEFMYLKLSELDDMEMIKCQYLIV